MKTSMERAARISEALAEGMALLCAVFMLCAVPLLFNDAFFDINRFKVKAVICVVPLLGIVWSACVLLGHEEERMPRVRELRMPYICLSLLLIACIASCAMAGFAPHTLTGENGRYCGLYFMLACGAAFFIISSRRRVCDILPAGVIGCGACVSLLGVLNALGVDPLHFYAQIRKGQEQVFMSTIGHFDFFGTFLVMIFGLCGGYAVLSERRVYPCAALAASFSLALGMSASRTDSAFLGMHLVCLALTAVSGGKLLYLGRALLVWAGAMLSLPAIHALLPMSPYGVKLSGLPLFLCESGIAAAVGTVMVIAGLLLFVCHRRGKAAPGRGLVLKIGIGLMIAGILGVLLLIVYFTCIAPDVKLGSAAFMLRFNDHWGSLRGFVYTRSLRAYSDFTTIEKFFGRGMETTLATLQPYFDNPDMLVYGVFNDTHCQPLQMLLTCGALGMTAFISLYASLLVTVGRHMKEDPLLCGVFASLIGYLVILAINVTQPILISTYFSLSALALGRIRTNRRKEVNACES